MSMDYDEIEFYEPGQADIILEEYLAKMREALTDRAKYEIERLNRENMDLKEQNKKLRDREGDVKAKARLLEEKEKDLERKFYSKKFADVLQPFMDTTDGFIALQVGHEQPKCEYCDDKRQLLFTASNGSTTLKSCDCDRRKYRFDPVEVSLKVINFYKSTRNGNEFVATAVFDTDNAYNENTYFKAETRLIVDTFTDEIPALAKSLKYEYRVVFKSAEECQKYCDWLNSPERKL